ncbi:MAG: Ig-like domain-containing protein, partial [Propionibacteriaceae bacterium]|nr:Ig-like domain-containing protein [Propionibacteriaceae bacterium]
TESYTGTLSAVDAQGNPLPGLTLTDMVFSSSATVGTVVITGVTDNEDGTYGVRYTTTVADPTYTASVTYQGHAVGDPQPVPFKAGAAAAGPFTCTTPVARPGTHLEAAPASLALGDESTATALVTDANCNPVAGVPVTFSASPAGTSSVDPSTPVTTGADGTATAAVGSVVAGTVTVTAGAPDLAVGTAGVTFTTDGVSAANSTFIVTPVANLTDSTTWQVVGTGSYTGTLTVRDGNNVPLIDLTNIVFTPSTGWITQSAVTNHGGGVYTVTFTSTTAGLALVTAAANGTTVGAGQLIPFQAGAATLTPAQCPAGAAGPSFAMNPVSVAVGDSSQATAYITDTYCNPVADALVTYSLVTGSSALLDSSSATTDSTGYASVNVTDLRAEVVTVQAAAAGGTFPDATVTFVDNNKPLAPAITAPAAGAVTNQRPLAVAGTGMPNASVTVADNGTVVCTATVNANGDWTCPVTAADGDHTLVATQVNPAGSLSPASAPVAVTVDTVAPAAPVITTANGQAITGTAEPGATVTVTYPAADGPATATATADTTGHWTLPTPADAVSGGLTAAATDPAGNTSAPATGHLDVDAPTGLTIDQANAAGIAGGLATPVDPGTVVTVTYPTASGATGTVTVPVAADGTWATPLPADAVSGPVTAQATDPAGNVSLPADATLDATAPTAPVVTAPVSGSLTNDATPTVTGTGEPGAVVTVTSGNSWTLCAATVAADGTWSCTVPAGAALADGPATLVVAQTDAAGNPSPTTTVTTTVDTTPPAAPVVNTADVTVVAGTAEPGTTVTVTWPDGTESQPILVDAAGDWSVATPAGMPSGDLTVEAADAAGNVSAPATAYLHADVPGAPQIVTANATTIAGTISTPVEDGTTLTITYPTASGTATATVPVNSDGTWTLATPAEAVSGALTAVAADPAGNESAPGTGVLDADVPGVPTITTANAQAVAGTVPAPVDKGTTVTLTWPDKTTTTVSVDANGHWTTPTPAGMASGELAVVATDPKGNVSAPATTTLDTAAPAAPVVTAPAAGPLNDATPAVTGTGEAGATVSVTDGTGNVLCAATVAADGTWTCTVPAPGLADGPATLLVAQTDPAGNVSPTTTVNLAVDTVAPAAPVITTANAAVIAGTADPGTTVTVTYPLVGGQTATVTVVPDAQGHWSLVTPGEAVSGTVQAVATDPAGNVSLPVTAPLDVDAPAAPAVTAPTTGQALGDPTPVVTGTGEPG